MGKGYKEELAEFKKFRRDPEHYKRFNTSKKRKLRPYKVTGIVTGLGFFSGRELFIGRYATPKDAQKAIKAAIKCGLYKEVKCEPPIPESTT